MIIGITGGVGSGKTTAASILADECSAKLLITDDIAKKQMRQGEIAYLDVISKFGEDILDDEKNIDREKLAKLVFEDKEKLELLNSCTHPHVISFVEDIIANVSKDDVVVIESAILKECSIDIYCDEIWYIMTNDDIREHRLSENRGYSSQKTKAIISNQAHFTKEEASKLFDKVIINDGNMENLSQQIKAALITL